MASRLYHWLLVAFLIYGIVNLAIELSVCSGEDQATVELLVAVLTNLWRSVSFHAVFAESFLWTFRQRLWFFKYWFTSLTFAKSERR